MNAEFRLERGERITRAVRKHWFVLLLEVLPFALMALVPLFIPNFIAFITQDASTGLDALIALLTLDNAWVRLMLGLWWLVMWIAAFNTFTSYYLNEWIITTHRIVEINQHGFFNREVSSLLLNRVQDVRTDVDGIFATLFHYGTLTIQSAGASNHFQMHGIPNPQEQRDLVMKEITEVHKRGHTTPVI